MRYLLLLFVFYLVAACAKDEEPAQAKSAPAQVTVAAAEPDGAEVYAEHCLYCHAAGPGHPGTMRLGLRLGEDRAVLTDRTDLPAVYVKTIVRQGLMLMPPFRPSEITDPELEALASYLAGNRMPLERGQ